MKMEAVYSSSFAGNHLEDSKDKGKVHPITGHEGPEVE
jgi:hypothetical protein